MKILKFNEIKINELEKNDYVIMNDDIHNYFLPGTTPPQRYKFSDFLKNNIGQIINVNKIHNNITVEFHNIPFDLGYIFNYKKTYLFNPESVKYYDKTIEGLKLKIESKKYNI